MSRCFPFPPPGYEKKTRVDDTDLLKKEKHKEKKYKKDKKEKEKKEGKEKRDKETSKEKHREKKDRKEKHKGKDKEKSRTSEEKRFERQPEFYNAGKFGSNNQQKNEIKDSIYMQELSRRIRGEERASGSQMVQKVAATDQRRSEVRGVAAERTISNQTEEKEKANNKNEDRRKINGQRIHFDARGLENAFLPTFCGMDQERVERIVKLVENKDAESRVDGKEKNNQKESDDKGDKCKAKERDKTRKSNDKDQNKEEKKEKAKEITELSKEKPKLNENVSRLKESTKDSLDFRNIKSLETLKLNNVSPAAEGNLAKRKEHEGNGYLLDNVNRPNKFARPLTSSNPAVENGKKLEPCRTAIQFASEKQGLANNHKVDLKQQKINGLIAAQQPNICLTKSSSIGMPSNENGEMSLKPHPDTKYLSQILSVPEMEELPDVDDQEWLFSSNYLHSEKLSRSSPGFDGTQQVWAEALQIESVDISALPYVIPY